jgi:polyphosphate kinase
MMTKSDGKPVEIGAPESYFNRELSWLNFARRVLALVEDPDVPLFERVKFAGIMGMLHDEFFMKRVSGLKRQMAKGSTRRSMDGRLPGEEFAACRDELVGQAELLAQTINGKILPALEQEGIPILNHRGLGGGPRAQLRKYVEESVLPILTPLAVDSEHPFPFVSNLGLNIALMLKQRGRERMRFVRIKVPSNLPRWVPLPQRSGFIPLEQLIAANLDLLYETAVPEDVHFFRVTRGAEGDPERSAVRQISLDEPGSIIEQVSYELKARKFAGVVRLQVNEEMPARLSDWLTGQLGIGPEDVYPTSGLLGLSDLSQFPVSGPSELSFAAHEPVVHPRLRNLGSRRAQVLFDEIARGDILLHHPYHCFETSVLRFIEAAARDPKVLGLKITIYRTSSDSPIVRALAEAARQGKQVVVLVEVTARFDEAPNIAWGKFLENEGAHVAYGVERLKTHVKLALVIRQEGARVRRYAHVGTGNYHPRTARIYEDLGILTCEPDVCQDVAAVFNTLTGATAQGALLRLLVAPKSMRRRFIELIRRETDHAKNGRPAAIDAKMNQLQDSDIIRELYEAGRAGVRIRLIVRGLCCLRPGVPGLSENIQVSSVVGRFLEHSRIFRFTNAGAPEYFIGSADWMRRNLSNRVETVVPVLDEKLKRELDAILAVYAADNASAWDLGPDGACARRTPRSGDERRAAQEIFIGRAGEGAAVPGIAAETARAPWK